MTEHEMLVKARAIIEKPENWKQGGLATATPDGGITGPYCSLGALGKAGEMLAFGYGANRAGVGGYGAFGGTREKNNGDEAMQATFRGAEAILRECMGEDVWEYNDSRDHNCVLALFDRAIEKAAA